MNQLVKVREGRVELANSVKYILHKQNIDKDVLKVIEEKAPSQLTHFIEENIKAAMSKQLNKRGYGFLNITRTKKGNFKVGAPPFVGRDRALWKRIPFILWRAGRWGDSVKIGEPKRLESYPEKVPGRILKEIHNFENSKLIKESGIKEELGLNYYVADVKEEPDPILFVQIGGMKELTIFIGNWE